MHLPDPRGTQLRRCCRLQFQALSQGAAQGSMGIAIGDISNRGTEDLLVTNLANEAAVFYRHEGMENLHDGTAEFGLNQPTFPYTGFGAQWFDYDNDGFLDLFIANGAVTRVESLRGSTNPYRQINQLFNNEDGKRFRETTSIAGPALPFQRLAAGRLSTILTTMDTSISL